MHNKLSDKEILAENRKFQLERISLFSDAVFAIAITLLIIELKLPEIEDHSANGFLQGLASISYHFFGFLFSFFFIGMYWLIHHKIFFYIREFDSKLLWLNIVMLLSIVIMPFTTAVAFELMSFPDYPFILYSLNHIFVGVSLVLLWRHLEKNKQLSVGLDNSRFVQYKKNRSLAVVTVFAIVIIMAFINTIVCRFSPLLLIPAFALLKRKYKDVSHLN